MVEKSDKANSNIPISIKDLTVRWFDIKNKNFIDIGRATKISVGPPTFEFKTVKDPSATLLENATSVANFCLSFVPFDIGKEKTRCMLIVYGPPSRVLDETLSQTEQKYHELIINNFTGSKLKYLTGNIEGQPVDEKQKLEVAIDSIFDGFAKHQKLKNKEPKIFVKENTKWTGLLKEAIEWQNKLDTKKEAQTNYKVPNYLKKEVETNPHIFKSAATKDVLSENLYKFLTPAEILTQRFQLTGANAPQVASALGFDISTVYHHLRGTRDVDRKAALRYAKFFNCDPADILFPPIKIPLTGYCDLIKKNSDSNVCEVKIKYTDREEVLCPRDFYSNAKEIKAIKINSPNSIYNNHIFYYYFTNIQETDCENKLCFFGVENELSELLPSTDYYIGIYENHRGITKILNPDPYRNKETILENPKIKFITPIVGIVNVEKVKFSPAAEYKIKKINENEELKEMEKKLEIAEQQWWITNQKLSGNTNTVSKSKISEMDKMYKDLRKLRMKVDQLRRAAAIKQQMELKELLDNIETVNDINLPTENKKLA